VTAADDTVRQVAREILRLAWAAWHEPEEVPLWNVTLTDQVATVLLALLAGERTVALEELRALAAEMRILVAAQGRKVGGVTAVTAADDASAALKRLVNDIWDGVEPYEGWNMSKEELSDMLAAFAAGVRMEALEAYRIHALAALERKAGGP
jgi:hypothetical protein